jgi:SNF family Na+-dependent transporter
MNTLAIVLSALAALIILYFIIRAAVSSGISKSNKEIVRHLNLANKLKIRDLLKKGITEAEIKSDVDKSSS